MLHDRFIGLGEDFVIIDAGDGKVADEPEAEEANEEEAKA